MIAYSELIMNNFRGVFFQEGDEMKMNMSVESAFECAMETLLGWVGREVNLSKTHVFFRTFAPHHFFRFNY